MAYGEIIEASAGSGECWQISVLLLVCLVNLPLGMQESSLSFLAPPISSNCSDISYNKCSSDCPSIVWNKTVFKETITTEFILICGKEWLEQFSLTIWMVGMLIGNLLFGLLSDKYGRRKPIIVAAFIEMITGIAVSFAPNIWVFLVLRFSVAVAAGGTLCIGFVLIMECTGKEFRSYFIILSLISYCIGNSVLGLVGYLVREWRYVQIIISIPIFFAISYYWCLPESSRWLLSVGKYEKAIEVMERAAKVNNMPIEKVRRIVLDQLERTVPRKETFLNLFRHPLRTICICFSWIVLGLCISAFEHYIGRNAKNIFVLTIKFGVASSGVYVIFSACIERQGRRSGTIIRYALCLVTLLLITIIHYLHLKSHFAFNIGFLSILGRIFVCLNIASTIIWSGELFATPVRNSGIGLGFACAKLGSTVATYIFDSWRFHIWIPYLIVGVASSFSIFACFWLPETRGKSMPDSTEEAKTIGLD